MSRWSEAYKARALTSDSVDSVDNVPTPPAANPHSVNKVNSVTVSSPLDDAASDAAFEATERAAIIAERQHGDARARIVHKLPPAWGDVAVMPTAGARCYCCRGARWWCEAVEPSGWRCAVCHPPGHLEPGNFLEVVT